MRVGVTLSCHRAPSDGSDADHKSGRWGRGWSDERLLARATTLGRLLFSQDDDVLRVTAEWQRQGRASSGVIYAHQLSAGIGTLVRDLELVLSCCRIRSVGAHA